jgi:hypothetical protein
MKMKLFFKIRNFVEHTIDQYKGLPKQKFILKFGTEKIGNTGNTKFFGILAKHIG